MVGGVGWDVVPKCVEGRAELEARCKGPCLVGRAEGDWLACGCERLASRLVVRAVSSPVPALPGALALR